MKNKIFYLLLLLIFFPVGHSFSQELPLFDYTNPLEDLVDKNTGLPSGLTEQISVEIIPSVPKPEERVNISVKSYSTDFNKANFTWRINGEINKQGIGERSFSFVAPKSGKSLTIRVTIQKEEGGTIDRSFTFAPSDVNIIYEADTYTPPYYKGKALFTSESDIRFIAMPEFIENGITANPNNLVYKWSVNGSVIESASGYGKRVFKKTSNLISRPYSVEVEVSAINSNLKAKNNLYVENENPEILVYENNPILGIIFEKAILGNFVLEKPEITLQSIPFYFSTKTKDIGNIDYRWNMNGELIESGSRTSSITFKNTSGGEGKTRISLEAEHLDKILQLAMSTINLTFKSNENSSENFEL